MNPRMIACGVLTALLMAGSVWAHHNMSAIFDFNNRVTMAGTLSKIDWRNPHIELVVDTKDDQRLQTGALKARRRVSSAIVTSAERISKVRWAKR